MALAVDAFVIVAAVGPVLIIARSISAAVVTSEGEHHTGSLKHGFHSSPLLDLTNILTFEDFVDILEWNKKHVHAAAGKCSQLSRAAAHPLFDKERVSLK